MAASAPGPDGVLPVALTIHSAGEFQSRPELEAALGMSRQAVAAIVQGRGRPGRRLLPQYPPGAIVGVDLGHRHVGVAVATFDLAVQAEERFAVDVDGHPDAALNLRQAGSEDVEPEDLASGAWVEWREVGPDVWAPPG
ncbi:hypothetical protein ACWCQS_45725 [Streptomyces sp. NPDC002076]